MKTHDEIKAAYFEMMETAEIDSLTRLKNGFKWMVENGYKDDVLNYAEENGFDGIYEMLADWYYGSKKESKMASLHCNYHLDRDERYNATTKRYERI